MARWNLRRGGRAGRASTSGARSAGSQLADALVDGYDPTTGIYEQFAGFHGLEPLVIADVAPRRPIAADLLLGASARPRAQVLKQADVLMLHHLVPDEVAPGSLLPEPRLLRAAHRARQLAVAGDPRRAARPRGAAPRGSGALRIAARIDLDDLTGSTAGGLHLATMGGLWQALAFGFAGVRPRGDALVVDPRLPPEWGASSCALLPRLAASAAHRPQRRRAGRGRRARAAPARRYDGGGLQMTKVIAALDTSMAANPVLRTAVALSEALGAEVEAVHVDRRRRP